ncbi:protein HUA2-LIKE 2-like [Abrus precatorius]|uniref:Protein HUA2-LIKE 2-like n=1 Tax=Abrus precatorius TaxID=3816 RepID=A0A8B8LF59_ABRPR|nr:protein HUA2-LIKE 2-like [Abrus precatorius]
MPPSRRKAVKKAAAAAAAACRQWKVGDLVLAKVKGFPPWPATVSEPEKWGYTADWKKVLVYFFGTQQIAFCNPADVEAFTEEKKQSLVKRQGRGADFVRAVNEIIESYEKLKRENQVDDTSSRGEVAIANVSNPLDPSVNIGLKDQMDAPLTIHSQMKSSNSMIDRPELVCAAEEDSTVAQPRDESYNVEASLEEPTGNAIATGTVKSPFLGTQSNAPVHRYRHSLRVQNFVVSCSDGGNSDGNISTDAIQNTSIRRSKRIKKSPDFFGCDDTDSSGFASNGSMEDNDSEIITINSDAFSLSEGNTIDSNLKLEQSETVINKKKRKPNKKKETNDAGAQNASQNLQKMCGNSKERCLDQDGDEHLPLLKRARVRMGKSSEVAELSGIVHVQEKSGKEDIFDLPKQIITSSNCENGSLAEGDSSALNGALVNVSPSNLIARCSENGSWICKIKKDEMFGCSVDDEAALPPSKRIHRALEAMSANVAEEGQACMESSCCISAIKSCPCITVNNGGNGLELQELDSCGIDCSHVSVCSFTTCSNPLIPIENESSTEVDKQLAKFQRHETGKDVISGEDLSDSIVCQPAKIDSQIQFHGEISPDLDVKCCQVGSNQDSPSPSLPPNDDDNIRPVNHSDASDDTLELGGMSLDPVACACESDKLLPQNSINMPQNVDVREDMMRAVGDSSKINDTHEVVKEVKSKGQEEDMNSVSISNDYSGEKGNLGILSSPSLTDGRVCLPQGSPPNTSVCNISTSDSSNILQNGSCSPDVHQKNDLSAPVDGWKDASGTVAIHQSRSVGKSTEAGDAALLYFEAMLGTLTRTKESIGRATRIAIDCGKFGIATKVVEILVHNLETESSLQRRVDLFFLVDSIAQCSRGLKGDIGGVYPSAMTAVLPRLLSAAAPPGNAAKENRRQCLKVLRLWLERRILPEPVIRHHIRELDLYSSSASAGVFSRRSLRTERAFDDPVRDMEGMLVDEYGSNSSFQLPGFCMPRMLDDEGSDSDGGNFEAVTPEHHSDTYEVQEAAHAIEKHRHVLEDVDGELEMEDVAPSFDVELNSVCNVERGNATQFENNLPSAFAPPLPQDVTLSCPPPPSSPPPLPPPPLPLPPPPPPTLHLMSATSKQYHVAVDSKSFTDSLPVKANALYPMAQPVALPRNSEPISDAVQYTVHECRDRQMQMPESTCSFNTYPGQPPDNSRNTDGVTMHNKGYSLRPPHYVPSHQFSFVHGERRMMSEREVPPPPSFSNRHHFAQNMTRENVYDNHERLNPPSYDYQERWGVPAPYSGPRYHDKGVPAPYGCHPSESSRLPGHGWRFPPQSMNYRGSMPFRPHFEDPIHVANRGPSFWQPR